MSGKRRANARRGVVLVAVLWTISLLSALAMAASTNLRGFAGLLAVDRDRVQAEALFTAGIEAAADLLLKRAGRPLEPIETRVALRTGEARVRLADELGRIDLNNAPVEVIASLLHAVGAPDAVAVARALVRWRDREAEPAASAPPAKPAPGADPSDRPRREQIFANVDQLTQIPEVPADYARLIAPFVTVFGDETVNASTASPDVLRVLPRMTEARLDRLLAARRAGRLEPALCEQILGPASSYAKPEDRSVARLEITVALADGFEAEAEAVIVLLPKDVEPYRVLAFRQSSRPAAYARANFQRE